MKDDKTEIVVGNFTIIDDNNGNIWIQHTSGEGAQFKTAIFEQAIEKFYNEYF